MNDRQRRAMFAKMNTGHTRSNVNPTIVRIRDSFGRTLKTRVIKQKNKFLVKDSQGRTIASGSTRLKAIKRAKLILS